MSLRKSAARRAKVRTARSATDELGDGVLAEDGEADAEEEEGGEGEGDHVGAGEVVVADVVGEAAAEGGERGGGFGSEEGVEDGEQGEEFEGGPGVHAAGAVGPGAQMGDLEGEHEEEEDEEGDPAHEMG